MGSCVAPMLDTIRCSHTVVFFNFMHFGTPLVFRIRRNCFTSWWVFHSCACSQVYSCCGRCASVGQIANKAGEVVAVQVEHSSSCNVFL
jgi:hypothetical protein